MVRALLRCSLALALMLGLAGPVMADRERRVAAATGADAPGFLHDLLAAPILGGQPITEIRPADVRPAAGHRGVDFVFSCSVDGQTQLVRAGLDRHGHVVSAELLLISTPPKPRRHERTAVLAAALERGARVERLRWDRGLGGAQALIVDHDGGATRLPLSQFGRERLDCGR